MTSTPDPEHYRKSGARMFLPNTGTSLAAQLSKLANTHKRESLWWETEVKKLIPVAFKLQTLAVQNLTFGFVVGVATGGVLVALAFASSTVP